MNVKRIVAKVLWREYDPSLNAVVLLITDHKDKKYKIVIPAGAEMTSFYSHSSNFSGLDTV